MRKESPTRNLFLAYYTSKKGKEGKKALFLVLFFPAQGKKAKVPLFVFLPMLLKSSIYT